MAILEKEDIYIVTGATSGIGKAIGEFIERDYYPIGGRNIQTLSEVANTANKKGLFIPGNLFEEGTSAYNFFIEELGPQNYTGVVQFFASVDMDPIPVEENGIIIPDYFDPRNGKKWESHITPEERRKIRVEMANQQIHFWEQFLESLLQRTAKGSLVIIHTNSIISKFYENHSMKGYSEYGRLKNTITQLIESYHEQLESKNVFIKNVMLSVIDTPMFNNRGRLSAEKTQKVLGIVAPNVPINGEEITIREPFKSREVAEFLFKVSNVYAKATPNKINLFHPNHFDIERLIRNFVKKKNKIVKKMSEQHIFYNDKNMIIIDNTVKHFLIKLREESLHEYYEKYKQLNTRITITKLKNNLTAGKKIVETLEPKLSKETFLSTCLRLEENYP